MQSIRFYLIAGLCILVLGCASTTPESEPQTSPLLTSTPTRDEILKKVLHIDNGLEVRKWLLEDDSQRIMNALAQLGAHPVIDEINDQRFQQNGFRLRRIPASDIEYFLDTLGGTTLNSTAWHGQILEWRELHSVMLEPQGQALAIDNTVRRLQPGSLHLMVRAWTVLLENDPYMHVEMLPVYDQPADDSLRRLFDQERATGQALSEAALDIKLSSGYAYILTSESPTTSWESFENNSEILSEDTSADDRESSANQSIFSRDKPIGLMGPATTPPTTIGQLLFSSRSNQSRRCMLVLIPKLPDKLFKFTDSPGIESEDTDRNSL